MKVDYLIPGKNGSMQRNPARIAEVLDAVRKHWEQFPELRLGQLIRNCSYPQEVHQIEDDVLMDRIAHRSPTE